MAKLPETRKIGKIRNLQIGESRFTVPWAMIIDESNNCYIQLDFNACEDRGGTAQLKVILTDGGYICEINDPQIKFKWDTSDISQYLPTDLAQVVGFEQKEITEMSLDELEQERTKLENSGEYEKAAKIRDMIRKKI